MTPAELLALIDSLDTSKHDIAGALAFLRSTVATNPYKTAAQLQNRPDVREAMKVLTDWTAAARAATAALVDRAGVGAAQVIDNAVQPTIERIEHDTSLDRLEEWHDSDEPPTSWAAKIVLRMQWLKDWLRPQAEWVALDAPYKRWESRLDDATCKYCRGLHGTVLPASASFITAAAALGYSRPYGGLFAPPLHPRCRCRLVGQQSPYRLTRRA